MKETHAYLASQNPVKRYGRHLFLIMSCAVMLFPVWIALIASTHELSRLTGEIPPVLPGSRGPENYAAIFNNGGQALGVNAGRMLLNSLISAFGISIGKILLSLLTAFALVFFRFSGKNFIFTLMLLTLMLPIEVRIIPTFLVLSQLGMINSYAGLIMPLTVSATAVFLFRQTFLAFPRALVEAAQMDGIGPIGFFFRMLLPMIRNEIGAMFVILFIYGWNQYLWPLVVSSRDSLYTLPVGINRMLASGDLQAEWNLIMAVTVLAMLPPVLLMIVFQEKMSDQTKDHEK